jgi:hypothetical protein
VFIEVSPDEEQQAMLEQNIQMALSKQDINLEDAIDIREIKNLKLANQLLKVKRKAKQEEDKKKDQQKQQAVLQQQMQSQQMAAQVALQKIEAEAQAKIQYRQADIAFELEKLKGEANLKAQLMEQEFNYNLQLQGMTQSQISQREQDKEKAKADRISQQNTQQSELITQRKNNLPPKKFESNEDTLDGFDLAEYEPR